MAIFTISHQQDLQNNHPEVTSNPKALLKARHSHCMALLDNCIYVLGGEDQ